jgi:protein TonB
MLAIAAFTLSASAVVAAQPAEPGVESASAPSANSVTAPASAASGASLAKGARVNANDPSCRPHLPEAARRAGVTGSTGVRFLLDASGKVLSADILQSAGPSHEHHLLDLAATQALAQCPFEPGRDEAGRPVGGYIFVRYQW